MQTVDDQGKHHRTHHVSLPNPTEEPAIKPSDPQLTAGHWPRVVVRPVA
jgi:hypothetical protein